MKRTLIAVLAAALAAACDTGEPEPGAELPTDDLPVGDLSADDLKDDGGWGAALTCKPVPVVDALPHPRIIVSLQGLTLHLVDETVGYDRVFPIGAGAINLHPGESSFGESLSYYPLIATGKGDFTIKPSTIQPCKIWWRDPATGKQLPVFAGLPFLGWYGNYGIHGPVDNYRAADGGDLRRGFVSHGCLRMEGADVLEVYGRIRGLASVPVHVQREPERDAAGDRIDVPAAWIGAECDGDEDCDFAGGFCQANPYGGRGFCSARCTAYCADRAGQPTTFCVADPDDPSRGMCTSKVTAQNHECRPYDHQVPTLMTRFGQSVTATVCMPGSPGWVGDRCFLDGDCADGTSCEGAAGATPGVCTMPCERYCPDQPGWADTFCVNDPALGAGAHCARQCTPASNASECPADHDCVPLARNGDPGTVRNVCVPR